MPIFSGPAPLNPTDQTSVACELFVAISSTKNNSRKNNFIVSSNAELTGTLAWQRPATS
jgi:hypothetical protein